MFTRYPSAGGLGELILQQARKSWEYGWSCSQRFAGAIAYRRSHGRTVSASRSGIADALVLIRPEVAHALERADGVEPDPAAMSARWLTGTHLDFGTPCRSTYEPNR